MRLIGVRDTARSIVFYRDVLGFEVRERAGIIEAVSGTARLQFGTNDFPPGDWENPLSPGSAILFFETDDVAGMRSMISAHGGKPSEIERINRIKMSVFELRDPDDHVLWFGQSYDFPDVPPKQRMLQQIMPGLPLDDVPAGVAYYRDVLGFVVNYQQHDLGVMDRDQVRLLLIARTDRHKGIGSAYLYVENADALYKEFLGRGANVQGEPVSQPWGLREFRVLDLEGNEISFGQPFE